MIVIVDCGMGNVRSVQKASAFLGKDALISSFPRDIKKAEKIIFPGVGHFGKAVRELKRRGIFLLLRERIKEGVPFLGICLGMQLLFEKSEEEKKMKGLGNLAGEVRKFKQKNLIVPHMGWNSITFRNKSGMLFDGIKNESYFYFVHSYYCVPEEKDTVVATTTYGKPFVSALHRGHIWGIQFHPEKSQALGLKVLNNFFLS